MKHRVQAARYARAFEAALADTPAVERAAGELSALAAIFSAGPEIPGALVSPAVTTDQKRSLLESLAGAAGLGTATMRLLEILIEKGHLETLPAIAEAMEKIRDRRVGIVEAEVTTATPLPDPAAARTREILERATGRKVRLSLKTDPELIGGLVARVGSTIYDGSIRTRLRSLRAQMTR